jgi:hypothetical protein
MRAVITSLPQVRAGIFPTILRSPSRTITTARGRDAGPIRDFVCPQTYQDAAAKGDGRTVKFGGL